MSSDYDDWQRKQAAQRREYVQRLARQNKADGSLERGIQRKAQQDLDAIRRLKQNKKAVKKAFKGGKANKDWKGSHTAKANQKAKGGCAFIAMAVLGGVGALVTAGATMRGWI